MSIGELLEGLRLLRLLGATALQLLRYLRDGETDDAHVCVDALREQAAGRARSTSSAATSALMRSKR